MSRRAVLDLGKDWKSYNYSALENWEVPGILFGKTVGAIHSDGDDLLILLTNGEPAEDEILHVCNAEFGGAGMVGGMLFYSIASVKDDRLPGHPWEWEEAQR